MAYIASHMLRRPDPVRRVPQPDPGLASPRKQHALELFAGLPRHYDAAGAVLSFGQDPRWRHALVAAVGAERNQRVLDVATGTGMVARALARASGCQVVGVDQSRQMLARARAVTTGIPSLAGRISFIEGQAERLPFADGEFDHVTFTYLLRYVDDPGATVRELVRVLKPGGRLASLEFGVPSRALARGLWRGYTRVGLPALGRLVSRDWYDVGRFLGPSIEAFNTDYPPAGQRRLWEQTGLRSVEVRRMSFGAGVVMSGTRGGDPASP
jgi:demethylmenaquinone methyltransferase / 2-methoxy-6-polyprenyl-1,4-benzoquinol methylase